MSDLEKESLKGISVDQETITKRSLVRAVLIAAHICEVRAEYSGSGDEGQINDVTFQGGNIDGLMIDVDGKQVPVREQLDDMLYNYLEACYQGWEIDEGSSGEFSWDIVPDILYLRHTDYETVVREHEDLTL
jgi:hypothetical protein